MSFRKSIVPIPKSTLKDNKIKKTPQLGDIAYYLYILDSDIGKFVYNLGLKCLYLNGYDKYGRPELSEISPITKKTSYYILKEN